MDAVSQELPISDRRSSERLAPLPAPTAPPPGGCNPRVGQGASLPPEAAQGSTYLHRAGGRVVPPVLRLLLPRGGGRLLRVWAVGVQGGTGMGVLLSEGTGGNWMWGGEEKRGMGKGLPSFQVATSPPSRLQGLASCFISNMMGVSAPWFHPSTAALRTEGDGEGATLVRQP